MDPTKGIAKMRKSESAKWNCAAARKVRDLGPTAIRSSGNLASIIFRPRISRITDHLVGFFRAFALSGFRDSLSRQRFPLSPLPPFSDLQIRPAVKTIRVLARTTQ